MTVQLPGCLFTSLSLLTIRCEVGCEGTRKSNTPEEWRARKAGKGNRYSAPKSGAYRYLLWSGHSRISENACDTLHLHDLLSLPIILQLPERYQIIFETCVCRNQMTCETKPGSRDVVLMVRIYRFRYVRSRSKKFYTVNLIHRALPYPGTNRNTSKKYGHVSNGIINLFRAWLITDDVPYGYSNSGMAHNWLQCVTRYQWNTDGDKFLAIQRLQTTRKSANSISSCKTALRTRDCCCSWPDRRAELTKPLWWYDLHQVSTISKECCSASLPSLTGQSE